MPLPEVKLKPAMGTITTALVTTLAFTQSCDAFFRNLLISDTAMARVDPIVSRGKASAHVHHLNGGGGLSFESTGQSLSASNCTNSVLTQDKSAYWAPWLYFQHDNGTIEDVKLALGLTAYYKYETRGIAPKNAQYSVFPKGLKMISGDTNKRKWVGPWPVPDQSDWGPDDTTQEALASKALGFNCMNYVTGKDEPTFGYPYLREKSFLDANCPDGIRAEILFPSCWDGKNLDSDDHKSHVAFPSLIQDGTCPDTHPVYLPILFYETIWQTNAFVGVNGKFVFANGDPTGYGYHGDFIAAWDDGVQEQVKENPACTGLTTDGQVENCPVFNGHIQSQENARACKLTIPDSIADEQTDGFLEGLPGKVKISGIRHDPGTPPGGDDGGGDANAPTTSIPPSRSSAMASHLSTDSASHWYSPITGSSATTSMMSASVTPTNPAASTITTTYTSDRYVVELVLIEMTKTVTATSMPTWTQTVVENAAQQAESAKARLRRHGQKHAHNHGHF